MVGGGRVEEGQSENGCADAGSSPTAQSAQFLGRHEVSEATENQESAVGLCKCSGEETSAWATEGPSAGRAQEGWRHQPASCPITREQPLCDRANFNYLGVMLCPVITTAESKMTEFPHFPFPFTWAWESQSKPTPLPALMAASYAELILPPSVRIRGKDRNSTSHRMLQKQAQEPEQISPKKELGNNRRIIRTFLICIPNQIPEQKISKWKLMTITSQIKKPEPWVKFPHSFKRKLYFILLIIKLWTETNVVT